jgi:hypothetical protein
MRVLLSVACTLTLAACGGGVGTRDSYPGEPGRVIHPLPSQPRGEPVPLPTDDYPPVPQSIAPGTPRSAEDASGPAVQSLVLQARAALSANRPDQAVPLLQRAQRIEQRNPFLWQLLATAYLALGQMDQAESTAQKANSLARGNPYVEVENWKVIAATRQAAGDVAGALQAQARVDELNRLLGQ